VTALTATAGDASVDLSWTNPATSFDAVRVVRKAGTAPADANDGTVVLNGTGTSVADTGLTNGTTYHYAVWTVAGGVLSTPARATATPSAAQQPPDPVSALDATAGDGRVDLAWTNPATPFDVIKVVRKAGSQPADPSDGTVVFDGLGTGAADTGLTNGTTYHYGVWTAFDLLLSTPARTSATPAAAAAPGDVTDLQATAGAQRVDLAWTNPAVFDEIHVLRKLGEDPASPTDGDVVYTGTGTSAADTGLTDGSTYHYAAWAKSGTAFSATPARATATPQP
jgi:cellulose 1,4-beta-cellobiosidase